MNRRDTAKYLEVGLVPLAFIVASVAFRALLGSAPTGIATDLAQPLPVATTWHAFGQTLWLVAAFCVLGAAIPYVRFLRTTLRPQGPASLGFILITGTLAAICALSIPVLFSSDVYAYAAYGWMDLHGISPYAHDVLATKDPLIRAAMWQWSNPLPACVYGPVFVWIAKAVVAGTAAGGVAVQLLALRALSCGALILCGALAYSAFSGKPERLRLAAAGGIVLNPVAIWIAAEGHNDTLLLAFVLAGFIALRRFGFTAGAFVIASSALIKLSGMGAALALAVWTWPSRRDFTRVVTGIVSGAILTIVVTWTFASGAHAIVLPSGHYSPQFSVQFAVWQSAARLFGHAHSLELGVTIALVATSILALIGIRSVLQGDREGFAFLALALWFAIPNPYPWYALWIVPVAFLSLRSTASWAIIAASITIFARYLPDTSSSANVDFDIAVTWCEIALPLALLAARGTWATRRTVLE